MKNPKLFPLKEQIVLECKQDNCFICFWNNLSNWKNNFFVAELTICKNVKNTHYDIWIDVYLRFSFEYKSYHCGFFLENLINENDLFIFHVIILKIFLNVYEKK